MNVAWFCICIFWAIYWDGAPTPGGLLGWGWFPRKLCIRSWLTKWDQHRCAWLQLSFPGSAWLLHIEGFIKFWPILKRHKWGLKYLESTNKRDEVILLLIRESSTTRVVSLTSPLALAAFCSSSSRLSNASSMEASYFLMDLDGLPSRPFAPAALRLPDPKQKQQPADSVIILNPFIITRV